jgi:polyhydroxyalkanoate synthase
MPDDASTWFDHAAEHKGSWWPDWSRWLAAQAGPMVKARKTLGGAGYTTIEPAPGRYVKIRAL